MNRNKINLQASLRQTNGSVLFHRFLADISFDTWDFGWIKQTRTVLLMSGTVSSSLQSLHHKICIFAYYNEVFFKLQRRPTNARVTLGTGLLLKGSGELTVWVSIKPLCPDCKSKVDNRPSQLQLNSCQMVQNPKSRPSLLFNFVSSTCFHLLTSGSQKKKKSRSSQISHWNGTSLKI